ncbi:hypothetical protein [Caproiciproducens sp. CPB-2]|uniref:hypothetical protein n=1 Tax=Caproiciproducens sp. CPB-2 TaxID=3030017 RepID=UPI0023D9B9AB|nr:hypothetical protein [Caproiciproducens sp. CPB-2]MDF1496330.1 hypothetical protein [Caproiciproducens sp. CPB-2]
MFYLANVFNNEETAEIAQIHKDIWNDIQNVILNENTTDQQGYILPRGTGKSAFRGLSTCIWTIYYGYKKYILYGSSIGSTAEKFIKQIRVAIEDNDRITASFGRIYDNKDKRLANNSTQIEFSSRAMIESVSSMSPLRGRKNAVGDRPDLIILDDFQDEDDVRTEAARENKWKRYSDDVKYAKQRPLYDKDGKIKKRGTTMLALGTLICKQDFYDRLRNLSTWEFRQEKGVLIDDVDQFFHQGLWEEFYKTLIDKNKGLQFAKEYYYQHEKEMQYPVLWPEFWNCLDLAKDYYENPLSFKQEVQGDIENLGKRRFNTIVTESAVDIENHTFQKSILSIDPAGTARTGTKRDYYAYCVLSQADNSVNYARKSIIRDYEMSDYIKETIQLLKDYPDIQALSIEKNVYSGADAIRIQECIDKDDELTHRGLTIINKSRTGNKDNRINAIVGDINMGRVVFNEEDTEAIEQLHDFCGCRFSLHDDYPDCLADALEQLPQIKKTSKLKVIPLSYLGL